MLGFGQVRCERFIFKLTHDCQFPVWSAKDLLGAMANKSHWIARPVLSSGSQCPTRETMFHLENARHRVEMRISRSL